jgi:hypothetical protein
LHYFNKALLVVCEINTDPLMTLLPIRPFPFGNGLLLFVNNWNAAGSRAAQFCRIIADDCADNVLYFQNYGSITQLTIAF